jgi:hypothetical protein
VPTLPKIDDAGLKILFLLIPGIISLGIVKSLGPKRPRSDFESGLQIFIYGIICYAIVGILEGFYRWNFIPNIKQGLWETVLTSCLGVATLSSSSGIDTGQIALASIVAVIIGLTVANLQSHSQPHRLLRYLSLTKRTNEVDIWELTLNSPDIDSWVTVRNKETGKIYQGWISSYSDSGDERELLLVDVKVFVKQDNSPDLFEVDTIPVLYLGLDRKNTVLELFRKPPHSKENV